MIQKLFVKIENVAVRVALAENRNESENVTLKSETFAVRMNHPLARDFRRIRVREPFLRVVLEALRVLVVPQEEFRLRGERLRHVHVRVAIEQLVEPGRARPRRPADDEFRKPQEAKPRRNGGHGDDDQRRARGARRVRTAIRRGAAKRRCGPKDGRCKRRTNASGLHLPSFDPQARPASPAGRVESASASSVPLW